MQPLHLVVGSGPTGVSCAMALLARGCRVEMIDAGVDLEQAAAEKVSGLQAIAPVSWTDEKTSFLRAKMDAGVDGIPLKLAYGSDYPYRLSHGATAVECHGADSKPSCAKGGLSNVWGSAVMPYRQADMDDWPAVTRDLSEHYRAVTKFMPVAASHDNLAQEFPTYTDYERPMPASPQAAALTTDWGRRSDKLKAAGVTFGRSRLAVNTTGIEKPGPCVKCGLCMYGCPYRLIWSSADAVDQLRNHPGFAYRPGLTVTAVSETASEVQVKAQTEAGECVSISGARVYLAAGVMATTAILLRSLDRYDQPVQMKDSQYFLLPMLRKRGISRFNRKDLHTLAQLFVEIMDIGVSPYTIHLQGYTYNELFEQPVAKMLGPLRAVFPSDAFFSRLFLFQGYLHSRHSQTVSLALQKSADGETLRVTGEDSPEVKAILRKVVRKLVGLHGPLGAVPLAPLMRPGFPGRGFHSGGVFPMSDNPSQNESDIYGRPAGLRRIHAVDSTVMSSIAATTVTFTAMANAHRIGTLAPGLEN
jgi:ferredoxin